MDLRRDGMPSVPLSSSRAMPIPVNQSLRLFRLRGIFGVDK
jgi:hypothetical protein